jgi:hypothetical protein
MTRALASSLPGLTRQSMLKATCKMSSVRLLQPGGSMDARVKPAHDAVIETC